MFIRDVTLCISLNKPRKYLSLKKYTITFLTLTLFFILFRYNILGRLTSPTLAMTTLSSCGRATSFLTSRSIITHNYFYPKILNPNFFSTNSPPLQFSAPFVKKLQANHHLNPLHPLGIIKKKIDSYFSSLPNSYTLGSPFAKFEKFPISLTTEQNFDELLIKKSHPSRSASETFYLDENIVIRTQATAHQPELLKNGIEAAIWAAVVARKDEIDRIHYPIFHQYDSFKVFGKGQPAIAEIEKIIKPHWNLNQENVYRYINPVILHLQCTLEGLIDYLFGQDKPRRWDYSETFPFTSPSLELEVYHNDNWIELLGCGQIHPKILKNCSLDHLTGWAFGMGLDRLTMVLFNIPDIRLLWTEDERFHEQFLDGEIKPFKPFSKHPGVYKDVAFWMSPDCEENQLFQLFRESAGDLLESVKLIDEYTDPNDLKKSKCYRLVYRSLERNLTNDEINLLHISVVKKAVHEFNLIER